MDRSINTSEAARLAGVSGDTIRRWAHMGYLHPIRVGFGRRFRYSEAEVRAVIDGSAFTSGRGAAGLPGAQPSSSISARPPKGDHPRRPAGPGK